MDRELQRVLDEPLFAEIGAEGVDRRQSRELAKICFDLRELFLDEIGIGHRSLVRGWRFIQADQLYRKTDDLLEP